MQRMTSFVHFDLAIIDNHIVVEFSMIITLIKRIVSNASCPTDCKTSLLTLPIRYVYFCDIGV